MQVVNVVYHREDGRWWADSPEVPNWTATADSVDRLRQLAEDGLRFALESDDLLVIHSLDTGVARHADVTFDFLTGRTLVRPKMRAHWHALAA